MNKLTCCTLWRRCARYSSLSNINERLRGRLAAMGVTVPTEIQEKVSTVKCIVHLCPLPPSRGIGEDFTRGKFRFPTRGASWRVVKSPPTVLREKKFLQEVTCLKILERSNAPLVGQSFGSSSNLTMFTHRLYIYGSPGRGVSLVLTDPTLWGGALEIISAPSESRVCEDETRGG